MKQIWRNLCLVAYFSQPNPKFLLKAPTRRDVIFRRGRDSLAAMLF